MAEKPNQILTHRTRLIMTSIDEVKAGNLSFNDAVMAQALALLALIDEKDTPPLRLKKMAVTIISTVSASHHKLKEIFRE